VIRTLKPLNTSIIQLLCDINIRKKNKEKRKKKVKNSMLYLNYLHYQHFSLQEKHFFQLNFKNRDYSRKFHVCLSIKQKENYSFLVFKYLKEKIRLLY
jgi:hypothetical protein